MKSKKIKLTRNKYTIVDNDDYKRFNKFKWCAHKAGYKFYVTRSDYSTKPKKFLRLHREIMNAKKDQDIDHINGNTLDNRKCNLRICNQSKNNMNRKQLAKNNKSGYKGVYWHKRDKKWAVVITINNKDIYLGYFNNKKDAAKTYNEAAQKYFGEFARLNKIT